MAAVSPTSFSVSGKTAIVTGAGSGINLSFAKLLLSHGCNVVFADLALRPEAQEVVDAHSSTTDDKPRAVFVETDVVQWPQLQRMFDVADQEFGGVDIVCPGAGIYEPKWSGFWHPPGASPVAKDTVDGGRYASFDINITHPIRTTQLAIAAWLSPKPGQQKVSPTNPKRIIHISSIAAQMAAFPVPLYIASKHAISGFVRSLATLDVLGIKVNGVAPGVIKTPLWTDHPEKLKFVDEKQDDWATAEEVADAMLKMLEDNAMVGGTILEVGHNQTRLVNALNDPGPSGSGNTVSSIAAGYQEVFDWLGQEGWGRVQQSKL
ncbi:MAG: hypothetical protein M1822_001722 [Bathelium mastoideum]|nr:MAG: hypothetical protein M1822_001722 [Bathelium mastoideum]